MLSLSIRLRELLGAAPQAEAYRTIGNIKAATHLDLSGRFVVGRVTLNDRLELELQGKLHLS